MATTFSQRAIAAMSSCHVAKIASRSVGEPADADRRAEVVEHHLRVGDRAGEREELAVLVVVVPRVVGEAARAESGDAGAEVGVLEQPVGRAARDHQTEVGLGARQRVADPAEQSAARVDVRVEHVVEIGRPQVGVADHAPR